MNMKKILNQNLCLFGGLLAIKSQTTLFEKKYASCDDFQAQHTADELDKLFREQAGSSNLHPDPEEMQEILIKIQGKTIRYAPLQCNKTIRKPPQFQRLNLRFKMLTNMDVTDGIKFDMLAPLSQRFQLGGSWQYMNSKPNKFELLAVLSSDAQGNQYMKQDEMSFITTRSDSNGKLDINGSMNLGAGYSVKTEGQFQDADIAKAMMGFEFMKECTFFVSYFSF